MERILTLCTDISEGHLCELECLALWAQIQAHWFSEQNVSFATLDFLNAYCPVLTKSQFPKHTSEKNILALLSFGSFNPILQ